MFRPIYAIFAICIPVFAIFGCNQSSIRDLPNSPPPNPQAIIQSSDNSTFLWGFYDLTFDPSFTTVTAVPNRSVELTVNVVSILNSHPGTLGVKIVSKTPAPTHIDLGLNISLTNPLTQASAVARDVRGVFIGNGSYQIPLDLITRPKLDVDQYVLNADGFTRWFNPTEFFTPGVLGYTQGNFASPGYKGSALINPYKIFAEGLTSTGDVWTYLTTSVLPGDQLASFQPNTTNTRNYQIRFPLPAPGLKFNYAVVADWSPTQVAHAPETIAAKATITPDIFFAGPSNKGGNLILDLSMYNWNQPLRSSIDKVVIESSVLSTPSIIPVNKLIVTESGTHTLTWHISIPADNITTTQGNTATVIVFQAQGSYNQNPNFPNSVIGAPRGYFVFDIPVASQPIPPNLPGDVPIDLKLVATGLNQPINAAVPADGSGRIFVVERPGQIRIVQNGTILPTPFLDITSLVLSTGNEQGLLNVRFHPDYIDNGFFFINYTEKATNGGTVIARYKVSADPNVADPSSRKVILTQAQPFTNHNGGSMEFGPIDGFLYLGLGDGGSGGDPQGNGQNLGTFLAKILRIDINVPDPQTYAVPPSNPFVGAPADKPEIWAYGLRNPWEIQFDQKTGDLYIADVGQNKFEEIDFQPATSTGGENYGWSMMEGMHCFPTDPCTPVGVLPVAEYDHTLGCAIIGFGLYRGTEFPKLDGVYFAGDDCSGRVWGLARNSVGTWVFTELLNTGLTITGSGHDPVGTLYITAFPGDLYKLVAL